VVGAFTIYALRTTLKSTIRVNTAGRSAAMGRAGTFIRYAMARITISIYIAIAVAANLYSYRRTMNKS
jgi:hypothetical protein